MGPFPGMLQPKEITLTGVDRNEYASEREPESRRLVRVRYQRGRGMDPGAAPRTRADVDAQVGGDGDSTVIWELGIGPG
jgi:hypothetical protein